MGGRDEDVPGEGDHDLEQVPPAGQVEKRTYSLQIAKVRKTGFSDTLDIGCVKNQSQGGPPGSD